MRRFIAPCLLALFLSCGLRTMSRPRVPQHCDLEEPLLETATVNWGMAPGVVSDAHVRLPIIEAEVARMRGAGVLCFQELWPDEARDGVIAALSPDMYTYWIDTAGENERTGIDVCTPNEIRSVASCGIDKCSTEVPENQTVCALRECREKLGWMYYVEHDYECFNCVAASVGHPIDEIVRRCTQQDPSSGVTGASRAYGGRNGMLLASRWPLRDPQALRLRSSYSNRVALFARIELAGHQPIEVACTHVSTENPLPPNHPEFSDWNAEMISQVEDISALLKKRAGDRPQLLMADLNAGPEIAWAGISGQMSRVWARTRTLGFWSPAAEAVQPFCSTCKENTLRDSWNSYLIDHVLLRDPPGGTDLEPTCTYPIVDEPRGYSSSDGEGGGHVSDHFGVVVKFRLRTPAPP